MRSQRETTKLEMSSEYKAGRLPPGAAEDKD